MAFKHIYMLDNNLNQQKNEENDNYVLVSGQFCFALSNCMDWTVEMLKAGDNVLESNLALNNSTTSPLIYLCWPLVLIMLFAH